MQPFDKSGRPLYASTFAELRRQGELLQAAGYRESVKKPNMFWKAGEAVSFYADMRGTDEVPIWEDTRPLLYQFQKEGTELSDEASARLLSAEQGRLFRLGLRTRFSFYRESCDPAMWAVPTLRQCFCNKEFFGTEEFCSSSCEGNATSSLELR